MVQSSALRYEVPEGREQLPAGYKRRDVAGVAVDSRGDIYVTEVTWTFAVSRGQAREDCHTFHEFTLKP